MSAVIEREKVEAEGITPMPVSSNRSLQQSGALNSASPWVQLSVADRLLVLRRARHLLAERSSELVDAIPADLPRHRADSLVAEVLPLLEAIRFLEREAVALLAPRTLGARGLPFWLAGLRSIVERVPLGRILIIAPANYPLLLAGVQAVQALAAGNAVVWKPGRGGGPVAELFTSILIQAGLPKGMLRVTDESVATAERELAAKPDKILFTGSAQAGRAILHQAAETLTPVIAELSGADAVFVLPSADAQIVADAVLFGLRLNGSQTCMAPRRLIFVDPQSSPLAGATPGPTQGRVLALLQEGIRKLPHTPLPLHVQGLLQQAKDQGATLVGDPGRGPQLVYNALPSMAITHADVFAPVLSVLCCRTPEEAAELHNLSRLSLTAAVFGEESAARELSRHLVTTNILINDLIVPTIDPRLPFGGRRDSGFGLTRGREGLLELTAVRTITMRRNGRYRHFQPTTGAHEAFFSALIQLSHAATWHARFSGLGTLVRTARRLN